MTIYHKGDGIRLVGYFYSINDPDTLQDLNQNPTLKIYAEPDRTTPILTKSGNDIQHPSTGVYYYDYTAATEGQFIWEFAGSGEGGIPVLDRGTFQVKFI